MELDAETLARLRRAIARVGRLLNEAATAEGFTPAQASVLNIVSARGSVSMTQLVALEGMNPTMLSRIIAKLAGQGLVTRAQGTGDQRTAVVESTPAGREHSDRIRSRRAERVASLMEDLDDGVAASVIEALPALEALAERANQG
ncbi:MarR family winged helix-turn-helix transcriptional regulator [Prauserella cavernicola]|uniref:MarR family transcriptional regulator n=1 Tax=Prauserella cavernicola TaxID=2800127 RepID=A0A934QXJ7_9PSEU|nr:MarR family transcriptional regulator [Prauserella cavernicola]MBK1787354.1 MarR family transcriptional regulator [Prauserella cavernicola]